ncbi:MAG: glycosyltransferase family 2 protein [Promethearchaeota archaeon]
MPPTVSIIIPCYNGEDTISRAIESILNQTYQGFEIIIVNDSSTDNSEEVIQNYQKKDKRIRYIKHNINRGAGAARNTGIKNSTGRFLAFLDVDDEWLNEKLQKQVDFIENNKDENLGVVTGGMIFVDERGRKSYWMPQTKNNILTKLLKTGGIIVGGPSSSLMKKVVFDKCGLYDESHELRNKQDYEMCIRIAQNFKFDFIKEYLVKCYSLKKGITYTSTVSNPIKGVNSSLYILDKYKFLIIKDYISYSNHLKYIGIQYCWAGLMQKSRKYLLKSVKFYQKNFSAYLYILLTFLGKNIGRIISLKIGLLYKYIQIRYFM